MTGGVASGKTTVAQFFAELGAQVIDADRVGHELLRPGLPAYREILARFREEILDSSEEVDRKRLGRMVFAQPEKLHALNAILHPRIIERVEELAGQCHAQHPQAVVLVDAALLYEVGIADRFAKIVVAWCRPEQQIERLMAKTGITRGEAEQRLAAQMPAEEKRRRADYVIDCSGSLDETRKQVMELFQELKNLAVSR